MLNVDGVKNLIKKKFIQDVMVLQIGSFFSIAISAITSIIFARLLGADNYGIYALVFSFVGLVGIFMDVGAGYAVLTLLPAAYAQKNKQEIKNILSYFIYIVLFISLIVGLLLLIFSPLLADLMYHRAEVGHLARYIILAAIIRILFSLLTLILQSVRKIKLLTITENLNKFVYLIIPVLFVILGYGLWGIVFGHFISAILFFIFSFFILNHLVGKDKLIPSLAEILKNFKKIKFKKYLKFSILISLNKNLGNLFTLLPITFLGMFAATTSQIAYFNIATGYLGITLIFMTAIARILLVQLPKSLVYGKEVFRSNFKRVSLISGFGFIFLLLIFALFAHFLVILFYGQQYLPVVRLIYALSLGYILSGFSVGYSSFFRTLDKLKPLLLINAFIIVSGIGLFFFLFNFLSPLESAMLLFIYFSAGTSIFQGLFIIFYFRAKG